MSLIEKLKEWFDVILATGFVSLWVLWQARGRTIQKQKVQILKQSDDAAMKPELEQAADLDQKLEMADEERRKKEAELMAALNRGSVPSPDPGKPDRGSGSTADSQ